MGRVEKEVDIPRIQSRDVKSIQRGRIVVGLCAVGVELDGLEVWLEALLQFDARLLRALSAAAITNHVSHGCARGGSQPAVAVWLALTYARTWLLDAHHAMLENVKCLGTGFASAR